MLVSNLEAQVSRITHPEKILSRHACCGRKHDKPDDGDGKRVCDFQYDRLFTAHPGTWPQTSL